MLEVRGVSAGYGRVAVLFDVSLEVRNGEIVALVGSNGAGKSTLLRTISGLLKPTSGSILFQGKHIDTVPSHDIVSLRVAQVPEGRRLFGKMTVMDNLLMGAYLIRSTQDIQDRLSLVFSLFKVLDDRRNQRAETMSGGEQQMLAIGRGLMSNPKLLMLDEPSLGLMPKFVEAVLEAVQRMKDSGLTVLLVEQNVKKALEVSDRVYVLQTGRIVLSGTAEECRENEIVRKAYLGI